MNLAHDVDEYEKYIAAKAICATGTCKGLADIETQENVTNDEFVVYSWQMPGESVISGAPDLDTVTLDYHSVDPIFRTSESPFDELDEKLTDEEKVKKLISYVREESKIQFAHELAARLKFLLDAIIEDPDEVPISSESLRNFISFLRITTNLKYPNVVLTPSNEIRAQWRTAPNRHFAVTFLPTEETRYVIFTPNPKDPDKIDRLSGITSVDSLMETIQPHKVLEWASE
jgi:hypothetical protein